MQEINWFKEWEKSNAIKAELFLALEKMVRVCSIEPIRKTRPDIFEQAETALSRAKGETP